MNNERRFSHPVLTSKKHTISVIREGLAELLEDANIYQAFPPKYYILSSCQGESTVYQALKEFTEEEVRASQHYDIEAVPREPGRAYHLFCTCWANMVPSQDCGLVEEQLAVFLQNRAALSVIVAKVVLIEELRWLDDGDATLLTLTSLRTALQHQQKPRTTCCCSRRI